MELQKKKKIYQNKIHKSMVVDNEPTKKRRGKRENLIFLFTLGKKKHTRIYIKGKAIVEMDARKKSINLNYKFKKINNGWVKIRKNINNIFQIISDFNRQMYRYLF